MILSQQTSKPRWHKVFAFTVSGCNWNLALCSDKREVIEWDRRKRGGQQERDGRNWFCSYKHNWSSSLQKNVVFLYSLELYGVTNFSWILHHHMGSKLFFDAVRFFATLKTNKQTKTCKVHKCLSIHFNMLIHICTYMGSWNAFDCIWPHLTAFSFVCKAAVCFRWAQIKWCPNIRQASAWFESCSRCYSHVLS